MTVVSFQENESGVYLPLKNVKSVKITLCNKNSYIRSVRSDGRMNALERSGEKYVTIKINAVVGRSRSEIVLREFAMENRIISCEILFAKETKERLRTKCFIELYEKHCEAGSLESYTTILQSSGAVHFLQDN
ncbi:hypothetical protein ANAPRD1_01105 [Anaplasma phagocytophilum]|uniref:phage tail tube protein n=1 Tax=Anaplasma phagocytophilum TaxID=948 RepID=UPI0007E11FD6|nr:hypothetical protein [Anaplasma phagocytophilum]SCV66508.1 hypothetical protein ANAPRD1_01105 [Anaplasma phagocytophilum]